MEIRCFVSALNSKYDRNESNFDRLVLNLVPKEYQIETSNLYSRIMQVCSFISRMSDSYAIRMSEKLIGNII